MGERDALSSHEDPTSKHTRARVALGLVAIAAISVLVAQARAGTACNKRFTFGNGWTRDEETKLVWRQGWDGPDLWSDANNGCKALGSGWRLPTVLELATIVDDSQGRFAINHHDGVYWASTTSTPGKKYFVNPNGSVSDAVNGPGNKHLWRCVK